MQLTLRGIGPELAQHIRQLSHDEGISLNKAALRLLAKGAGLEHTSKKNDTIGADLDHLFGVWREAEARQFLTSIQSCEQVDEEFWK